MLGLAVAGNIGKSMPPKSYPPTLHSSFLVELRSATWWSKKKLNSISHIAAKRKNEQTNASFFFLYICLNYNIEQM
jgi:hypothetical protein